MTEQHAAYVLGLGDDALVYAQRLGDWLTRAPSIEEDMALGNIGLDLVGQARSLLTRAGELEGQGRDEDALAMLRDEREFRNVHLVEQPGELAGKAHRLIGRDRAVLVLRHQPSEEELARSQDFNQQPQGRENPFGQGQRPGTGLAERALGLSLIPLTPQIAAQLGMPGTTQGLVVNAVDPSSDAGTKGLQRGDVILSVNRQAVTSTAQVGAAVEAARRAGRTAVLLLVKRGPAPEGFIGVDIAR